MTETEIIEVLASQGVSCRLRDGVCTRVSTMGSKMEDPFESRIRHKENKLDIVALAAQLPYLKELNLRKSRLGTMPDFVSTSFESIDISCNDLTEVPTWVYRQPSLQYLNLGANNITEIGRFDAPLLSFKAHKNPLTRLGRLPTTLRLLNLYMAGQPTIPAEVTDMHDLESLMFGISGMTELMPLGHLTKLKFLAVVLSHITTIPDDVCKLSKLEQLNLAKHELGALPENIGELTSLRALSIYGNAIVRLPESFYSLNLARLNVERNPLADNRVQDVFGGINYFRM